MTEVAGAEGRQSVVLEMAPDIFDRVELRGVGREESELDRPAGESNEHADQTAAVGAKPVPFDQKLTADRRVQGLQELDEVHTLNDAGIEAAVETCAADARSDGKLLRLDFAVFFTSGPRCRSQRRQLRPVQEPASRAAGS